MAKAIELSMDTMTAPPVPKAAQVVETATETDATLPAQKPKRGREVKAEKIEPREPLQVRWPGSDVKAAKVAALQLDFPNVSDFMLTCFHAYMQNVPDSRK